MKIIDFHTHPLYDFHRGTHGVDIDLTRFKNDLISCGISHACGSVFYSEMCNRPEEEQEALMIDLNNKALECRETMGDFYIPGIQVHPKHIETSCRELERCRAKNIRLVGELLTAVMGWMEYNTAEFKEIAEYIRELDMTLSIPPFGIEDLYGFCKEMPHLKIVVGHLKSDGLFEEQLELMRRFENVCFDTSAFTTDKDGTLRYAIDRVGSERIIFGTDYPGVDPAGDIAAINAEKLSYSEKENIFYKNAERLLF